ncbi:tRNA pseudouridine(38-40) synthase TruA [Christiangramia sabulilitoris]|uniref:tRNA pseudouridine synthase A n=1 Tax=Christiangramia sabulilitoris TaxID=2583991 RepID=A0A550HZ67_9FLAO|nr:tRNA pseudouridine(38-40) synthase TruA [Christiangramia sabulilitoris]TRO64016.1 tRNA pseudouridine(38-40) synthase TruA [Christiangramia sabulilitoris]
MRYFIKLSYFGKAYHGWQNQPDSISVQEVLEEKLSLVLRSKTDVVGAGRTDAGVHATQMFAHFNHDLEIDVAELKYKLNSMLPKDIAIAEIFEVVEDAHARFDAVSRSYEYHIVKEKNAFLKDHAWYLKPALDLEKMNEAAAILQEYTNFKCFSKTRTDVRTYNCRIDHAEWKMKDDKLIFHITADRFLRNMVRAVVGTLVEIGQGKYPVSHMHQVIKSEDRGKAGTSVPAHGLYLTRIEYPDNIRIR